MRSSRSRSVIDRYCLKPAIWSSTLRPSGVGAAIHQNADTTSGKASSGQSERQPPAAIAAPAGGSAAPVRWRPRRPRRSRRAKRGICRPPDCLKYDPHEGSAAVTAAPSATPIAICLAPPVAATIAAAASQSAANNSISPATAQPTVPVEQLALVLILQNLVQTVLRRREILVVLLLHHDRFAGPAESDRAAASSSGVAAVAGQPLEPRLVAGEPAAILLDEADVAAHAHVDQRRGEGAVVGAHLRDVAHAGGGEPVRRREDRHDRSGRRVAAGAMPGDIIINAEAEQPEDADEGGP